MQPIHIKRYHNNAHGYGGTIAPEDGSWVLFVDIEGTPSLWLQKEEPSPDETEEGDSSKAYAPA